MDEKGKGIIGYIFGWIGGLIVLFAFKDNNKKTVIHACQSIVVSGLVFVINILYRLVPFYIPFFSTVLWGLQIACIVMGIVKVVNNDENPELPVIGGIAKSIFKSKIESTPDTAKTPEKEETTTEAPKEEPTDKKEE